MEGADGMVKLNSINYSIWKCMMEDLLYCKNLYKPIKLGSAKPADISEGDWEVMHRKTVGHIIRWLIIMSLKIFVMKRKLVLFGKI